MPKKTFKTQIVKERKFISFVGRDNDLAEKSLNPKSYPKFRYIRPKRPTDQNLIPASAI